MAWTIGLLALVLVLAVAELSQSHRFTTTTRRLTRATCYLALANDLTPLVKDEGANAAANNQSCDEGSPLETP